MRLDVFVHIVDEQTNSKLNSILGIVQQLQRSATTMTAALDRLKADVQASELVTESAITLLGGLSQQIRDLKDDPAALAALADEIEASTSSLASAVTANTVASSEPPPPPVADPGTTSGTGGTDTGAGGADPAAGGADPGTGGAQTA